MTVPPEQPAENRGGVPAGGAVLLSAGGRRFLRYWSLNVALARAGGWGRIPGFGHDDPLARSGWNVGIGLLRAACGGHAAGLQPRPTALDRLGWRRRRPSRCGNGSGGGAGGCGAPCKDRCSVLAPWRNPLQRVRPGRDGLPGPGRRRRMVRDVAPFRGRSFLRDRNTVPHHEQALRASVEEAHQV